MRRSAAFLVFVSGLAGCSSDEAAVQPVQVVPDCATCTGGAPRAGVFVEQADLRVEGLVLPAAVHADALADADAARFLARIDGALGVAALPDLPLPAPDGKPFQVTDAIPDGDGGWYVVGRTWEPVSDTLLLAYDGARTERWRLAYRDGFVPHRLVRDGAGVLVSGYQTGADNDGAIRALDADGTMRFAYRGLPWIRQLAPLAGGGVIAIGEFERPFEPGGGLPPIERPGRAVFVIELDAAGIATAAHVVEATGPNGRLTLGAAAVAADGRVFLAGRGEANSIVVGGDTVPVPAVTSERSMTFVLALAPGGALAWGVTAPTLQPDIQSLAPLADGVAAAATVIIGRDMSPTTFAGVTYGPTRGSDVVVMALGDGRVRWQHTLGGAEFQDQPRIATGPDGALFAALHSTRGAPADPEATVEVGAAVVRGEGTLIVELGP